MALTKYKIGDLIEVVDERNNLGIREFFGININKEFMPTAANTEGLDETKYKVIRKNRFVFSGMQTGRDECIRISMYTKQNPILVSPAYTTFEVVATDVVLPMYFFLCFLSHEKDRFGAFLSDGSIRSNLDWSVFCDIELNIPPLEIQKKYVDIYNAMVSNQECYERGLEDLKLTCDAFIDTLKHKRQGEPIGNYITVTDKKNVENKQYRFAGLSMENYFIDSIADENNLDFTKYKIVEPGEIGCVLMKVGRDARITIARNESSECYLISPAYYTFSINGINSDYFMLNVNRSEFERRGWFSCDSSARGSLPWIEFCNLTIPKATEEEQEIVGYIYQSLLLRTNINNKLKTQIKDICPILIKGSIEEARKEA
ncbi:restriction endonuclease subunit S [Peptoniphilus duerdenii]|uniref:restriction endonuclease subunit S n=1 Tax=Peptoniphilus duerdenii TaxID=507750 RepID=UPI0028896B52|nr:restriction endonuclease subunit S [Peptoniphilus duerdenii]